jgi:hypothetical protein
MRAYLPVESNALSAFAEVGELVSSYLVIPTEKVAQEYGVSELEDLEYAALEIARAKSEQNHFPIIATFDFIDSMTFNEKEVDSGIITGEILLRWENLVALYRITDEDEELEWYDVSEYSLLLEKIGE